MTEKIILYSIIAVAVWTSFAFLTKATGKTVTSNESGYFNLRMNKLYGIMGIIGILFGVLILIFLPMTAEANDDGVWMGVIILLLIFWGTGIPCFMYYRNHRLTFGENSISATNVIGKVKEIKWSDISDIKFKVLSGVLVIKTQNEQIKVHQHLVGLSKFVEFIETKTTWNRKDLKVPLGKK
jgi:hypothetical protein